MAASSLSLLDLSTETLQQITGFLDSESLPGLRLTSRTLCFAADDAFVSCFFGHAYCFVLHPDHIERLRGIMSTPYLARRVRQITLTVNTFERMAVKDKTAYSAHAERHGLFAEPDSALDFAHTSFDNWETAVKGDWLYPSLATRHPKKCKINLNLHGGDFWHLSGLSTGVNKLLSAAQYQVFDIDDLVVDDQALSFPLEAEHMSSDDIVHTVARSITGLHFSFTCAELASAQLAPLILQQTKNLQRLSIDAIAFSHVRKLSTLPQQMWMNTDLSHLTQLRLNGIPTVSFAELSSLFERCRQTLQALDMSWIFALEPRESMDWSAIFSLIATAPQLRQLAVSNLHEHVPSTYTGWYYEVVMTSVIGSPGDAVFSLLEVDLDSAIEVQDYLKFLSRCKIAPNPKVDAG